MGIDKLGRAVLVVALIAGTLVAEAGISRADGAGSKLVEEVAPHEVGDNAQVRLETVAAFDPAGGDALFEPGTANEEAFSYDAVDTETNRLLGLSRPSPAAHAVGTFVEALPAPTPAPDPTPTKTPAPDDSPAESTEPPAGPDTEADSVAEPADPAAPSDGLSSVGVIPEPCDIVNYCVIKPPIDCAGCSPLVEQIVRTVEECTQKATCGDPVTTALVDQIVEELCGSRDVLRCEDEISRTLAAAIGELCSDGIATCADPTINFVANLVMDVVCPSGSIGYCLGELNGQVNDRLAFVTGVAQGLVANACGYATADACVRTVQALLDAWIFHTVCGSSNPLTCVSNLQDRVNDTVANVCRGHLSSSETGDSAVTNCVEKVYETIALVFREAGNVMIVACESPDADVCLGVLVTRVENTVTGVCNMLPGSSSASDVGICVEKVLEIVDELLVTVRETMRENCGSDDPVTCANRVISDLQADIEMVHDTVANVCRGYISSSSTNDSAVTNCIDKALELASDVMFVLCDSRDVNDCAAVLLERIDNEIDRICMSLPGDSSATGLDECIEKAYEVVDGLVQIAKQKMRETCGSDDPVTCANRVISDLQADIEMVHDTVANVCRGYLASTSTNDSAVTNCVNKVLELVGDAQDLVKDVMILACESNDVDVCLNVLITRIKTTVTGLCTMAPGASSSPDPVDSCVDRVLYVLDGLLAIAEQEMRETCGSADPQTCASNVVNDLLADVEMVHDTVANVCRGYISSTSTNDSAVTNCVNKALELVADALFLVCQSRDAEGCAAILLERIGNEIDRLCMSVPGSSDQTGAPECIEKALQVVDGLLGIARQKIQEACGSAAPAECVDRVVADLLAELAAIREAVEQLCEVDASSTDEGMTPSCAAEVLQAVRVLLDMACGSGEAPACVDEVLAALQEALAACQQNPLACAPTGLLLCVVAPTACLPPPPETCISTPDAATGECASYFGTVVTFDERLLLVAAQVPEFGGMYVDEDAATLYVGLTNPSPDAARRARDALAAQFGTSPLEPNVVPYQVQYPFPNLYAWDAALFEYVVANVPDLVYTDIDEAGNRLKIAVENRASSEPIILRGASDLGIPVGAVEVVEGSPVTPQASVHDEIRPIPGGVKVHFSAEEGNPEGDCTLGVVAFRNPDMGFVTNSHCSGLFAERDATTYFQPAPRLFFNPVVAREAIDPRNFNHYRDRDCPRRLGEDEYVCGYSDANFARAHEIDPDEYDRQSIAWPDYGSPEWDDTSSRLTLVGTYTPFDDSRVSKVGITTGYTQGNIEATCARIPVAPEYLDEGRRIMQLCQMMATYHGDRGDSGGPVFSVKGGLNRRLAGIHWGKQRNTGFSIFSSWYLVEQDLGNMVVCYASDDTCY